MNWGWETGCSTCCTGAIGAIGAIGIGSWFWVGITWVISNGWGAIGAGTGTGAGTFGKGTIFVTGTVVVKLGKYLGINLEDVRVIWL